MMKRVLITGDRNWTDRDAIRQCLARLKAEGIEVVIEGEARGADTIAREESEKLGLAVIKEFADWNKYGRAAGPIRNNKMLTYQPDLVVYFYHNLEQSRGTKHMVNQATKAKIRIINGAYYR